MYKLLEGLLLVFQNLSQHNFSQSILSKLITFARQSFYMKPKITSNQKSYLPLEIGVTGGIGSGKTTVCKLFAVLGIPVYYADDRAKALMIENDQVRNKIKKYFGQDTYFKNGKLNRAYLANIVFNDKQKLEKLNSIVHPAVGEDSEQWHNQQRGVPYTIKEAALMIESGSYKTLDKLILVTAPEGLRVKRVMERDNIEADAVYARMRNQMSEEEKLKFAGYVIKNDGGHSLIKQVWNIHQKLWQLFDSKIDPKATANQNIL